MIIKIGNQSKLCFFYIYIRGYCEISVLEMLRIDYIGCKINSSK